MTGGMLGVVRACGEVSTCGCFLPGWWDRSREARQGRTGCIHKTQLRFRACSASDGSPNPNLSLSPDDAPIEPRFAVCGSLKTRAQMKQEKYEAQMKHLRSNEALFKQLSKQVRNSPHAYNHLFVSPRFVSNLHNNENPGQGWG